MGGLREDGYDQGPRGVVVAMSGGGPLDAATAGRALRFFPHEVVGLMIYFSPGDRLGAICDALDEKRMSAKPAIQACAAGLAICGDGPLSPRFAQLLRHVARSPMDVEASVTMGMMLHDVADPEIRIAAAHHLVNFRRSGLPLQRINLEPMRGRILHLLPASGKVMKVGPVTIRQAERVGRNEPCPCGSGRKLKKCCIDTYEERLADASPEPGLTWIEYFRTAHRHVEEERLVETVDRFDLAQLPFDELTTDQLSAVYHEFVRQRMWQPAQRALEILETRGDRGPIDGFIQALLLAARNDGQAEVLRWAAARRTRMHADLVACELALMEESGTVRAVEDMIATALRDIESEDKTTREQGAIRIGHAVETAVKQRPGLGLLLTRGVIASGLDEDVDGLLRGVAHARELLGLPAGDPIAEEVEARRRERSDAGAEALVEEMRRKNQRLADDAERALEALKNARGQSRRNRARLESARKQLSALESELDEATSPDPRVAELQQIVVELECRALELEGDRESLAERLSAMEQEFTAQQSTSRPKEDDLGDSLYDTAAELPSFTHVLVPVWTAKARADLAALEPTVAAHTLDVLARVASGRAGEGARVKKLKGKGELWSARVGIGYRVLCSFDSDEGILQVQFVTARRDLEKLLRMV